MKYNITESNFLNTYKLRKAGISSLKNLKISFPISPNINLSKMVSYITFDGHLSFAKNMFYFSAIKKEQLREFSTILKREFKTKGRILREVSNTYKCLVFSKPLCRILHLLGVPSGAKVKKLFCVPRWILDDKEFSRAYLQVAFDCEGSIWKETSGIRIRINMHKSEDMLDNGISFMESLKTMLLKFQIKSTNVWIGKGNNRKDGIVTKAMYLKIKNQSIPKFKEEINFKIKNKRNLLKDQIQCGTK